MGAGSSVRRQSRCHPCRASREVGSRSAVPVVDSDSGEACRVAPFRQIAADLAAEIERGELAPGRPLPSERELTERYGVARNTAR
ncbi:GntR family transcriptional regulator [Streptomyces subrutilus]|uniref:GntR family transcriptional regulator n=1 Tax=Streptomyces subrutilus TaxID=36818 RepID=UPI0027958810|nr:GntR family transcriptional regulator [Streptomyces subrutilus]